MKKFYYKTKLGNEWCLVATLLDAVRPKTTPQGAVRVTKPDVFMRSRVLTIFSTFINATAKPKFGRGSRN